MKHYLTLLQAALAGLDEEDVVKGTRNIQYLKGMAEKLCQDLYKSKEDTESLLKALIIYFYFTRNYSSLT